jgi:hypothetical protein
MLITPAFRRLRQEDCEFKAILGYIARHYLKKKAKKKKKRKTMYQCSIKCYNISVIKLTEI